MESTVKQVAERVGLPSRTVRYYDRIRLVSPAERSEAGYRLYGDEEEAKLRFVRQAKALGFSLDEIRGLIAAAEHGSCGDVVPELERLLDDKLSRIDRQIEELRSFRERLVAYRSRRANACGCDGHGAFCGCLNEAEVVMTKTKELEMAKKERCTCGCCGPADADEVAGAQLEEGATERVQVVRVEGRLSELEERLAKLEQQVR
jgi:MerR family transcriptional regulator, copper efflux regulator